MRQKISRKEFFKDMYLENTSYIQEVGRTGLTRFISGSAICRTSLYWQTALYSFFFYTPFSMAHALQGNAEIITDVLLDHLYLSKFSAES